MVVQRCVHGWSNTKHNGSGLFKPLVSKPIPVAIDFVRLGPIW